jgi:hypothetical protein
VSDFEVGFCVADFRLQLLVLVDLQLKRLRKTTVEAFSAADAK